MNRNKKTIENLTQKEILKIIKDATIENRHPISSERRMVLICFIISLILLISILLLFWRFPINIININEFILLYLIILLGLGVIFIWYLEKKQRSAREKLKEILKYEENTKINIISDDLRHFLNFNRKSPPLYEKDEFAEKLENKLKESRNIYN